MFDEPDTLHIDQRHSLGLDSIANKIRRDTKSVLDSKNFGNDDFLGNELKKVKDESLKTNLVRHTSKLKGTSEIEEIEKEYRYNYN